MKNLIVWALLLVSLGAQAEIRETTRMSDVRTLVKAGTVVVFDIDNTILETAQTLGSDQWFEHQLDTYKKEGLSAADATAKAIALWEKVQLKSAVRPVEATTPALIRELQAQGVPVMALTARPVTLADRTHDQLASAGVGFRAHPITKKKIAGYVDGIVFVGPTLSKGQALKKFLSDIRIQPKRVVFADDKVKHTQTVDSVMTAAGIETIALRYGAADPAVQGFDDQIAERQLELFETEGVLISDDDAAGRTIASRARGLVGGGTAGSLPKKEQVAAAEAVTSTPYYRVFRGMRKTSLTQAEFEKKLGDVFIPATPETHAKNGLIAYLPAIPPLDLGSGIADFPSEFAIVAYRSEEVYKKARATPEGVAYADLHWEVFDQATSKSGGAAAFTGALVEETPVDVLSKPVDWQQGFSTLEIYKRGPKQSTAAFLKAGAQFLGDLKGAPGLLGAIAVARADWIAVYQNWESEGASKATSGSPGGFPGLGQKTTLTASNFQGKAQSGHLYNVRFNRVALPRE